MLSLIFEEKVTFKYSFKHDTLGSFPNIMIIFEKKTKHVIRKT